MRILVGAFFLFATLHGSSQQTAVGNPAFSSKLTIPAQVSKTVRADKVHVGDIVEFRTIQAVLVGNGVVIPANSALFGRVLGAGAKQNNRNSYLAVVVERAEWKDHTVPLHAFISAQITMIPRNTRPTDPVSDLDSPTSRRASRQSARTTAVSDPELSSIVRSPREATTPGETSVTKYPALENVGFFRDHEGITYLLSSKTNVKLPAGVLLMLQNQPVESADNKPAQFR